MLSNAVRAPSAGFSQGWAFLVLDTPEDVARFWAATTPGDAGGEPDGWLRGMRTAPVVIVPLSSKAAYLDRYAEPDKGWADREEDRWPVPYWHIDTGMASLLVLQTAVDEGLGACFFGIPPRPGRGVPDRVRGAGDPHPDRCDHRRPPHRRRRRRGLRRRDGDASPSTRWCTGAAGIPASPPSTTDGVNRPRPARVSDPRPRHAPTGPWTALASGPTLGAPRGGLMDTALTPRPQRRRIGSVLPRRFRQPRPAAAPARSPKGVRLRRPATCPPAPG